MTDGTIVVGVYGVDGEGLERPCALRSADRGLTWRLHALCAGAAGVRASEAAICETCPGRLTALVRAESDPHDHRLLQLWSEDGGRTWSEPARTGIRGHPAHLLKLEDGRILCTHGYRRHPMGVRAVLSENDGETWDTDNRVILRDDGGGHSPHRGEGTGAGDVGYPVSIQLQDGEVLTACYITPADNVTHSAVTIWRP